MDITKTWRPLDITAMKANFAALDACTREGMEIKTLACANAYNFTPMAGGPMQGICQRYLAVRTVEDGCRLRDAGVTLPILITEYPNPENTAAYVRTLLRNFLVQSLDNVNALRAVAARVIPAYGGVVGVHLNVEIAKTGRGFCYYDETSPLDDLIAAKSNLGMYCEGISTQLRAEEPDELRREKVLRLHTLADRLETVTGKPFAIRYVTIV